jgi:hypothetical protein
VPDSTPPTAGWAVIMIMPVGVTVPVVVIMPLGVCTVSHETAVTRWCAGTASSRCST